MSRFKALALAGGIATMIPHAAGGAPFDGSPEELARARQLCKREVSQQQFAHKEWKQMAFRRCVQSYTGQRRAK